MCGSGAGPPVQDPKEDAGTLRPSFPPPGLMSQVQALVSQYAQADKENERERARRERASERETEKRASESAREKRQREKRQRECARERVREH